MGSIALVILLTILLLPAVVFLALWWLASRRPRVFCLMYHRLAPREDCASATGTERIFTLPTEEFERQIAWLSESGYAFLTPDEIAAHAAGRSAVADPSVLITFDDGCLSVGEQAVPILRKYNARATLFVTTDPSSYVFGLGVGDDRRMTDEELRRADGDILTCAAHGVTHRPLSGLSDVEIRDELRGSKAELERLLGREVPYLAIPGNWFDKRVMAIAREVGYRAVWCSNPGMTRAGARLFGLPRVNIEGNLTLGQFQSAVSPSGVALRGLMSIIKRTPGRLLGPRFWLPLRRLVMRCIPGGYISTRRLLISGAIAAGVVLLVALGIWLRW